jgi:hypothetical protein
VKPTRSAKSTETRRRSDTAADAVAGTGEARGASAIPHSPQKRSPGSFAAPQCAHGSSSAVTYYAQKRLPGRFPAPHAEQLVITGPYFGARSRLDARVVSLDRPIIVDESLSWARSSVDRRRTHRVDPLEAADGSDLTRLVIHGLDSPRESVDPGSANGREAQIPDPPEKAVDLTGDVA